MKASRKNTRSALNTSCLSAWKIAEEHGVDMSLIENNLRKSPIERIMRHEQARHAFLILRAAGSNLNGR